METNPLKREVTLKEVIRVGPWSNMTGALIRSAHRGKAMWGHRKNMAICKLRKEASLGITLLTSWSWTCSLQKLREKKCPLLTPLSVWRFVTAVRGDRDLISVKPHKALWGMPLNTWTGLPCWLRTCLLILRSMVWSLVREDSTCHGARLCVTATEDQVSRARKRSSHSEKPAPLS